MRTRSPSTHGAKYMRDICDFRQGRKIKWGPIHCPTLPLLPSSPPFSLLSPSSPSLLLPCLLPYSSLPFSAIPSSSLHFDAARRCTINTVPVGSGRAGRQTHFSAFRGKNNAFRIFNTRFKKCRLLFSAVISEHFSKNHMIISVVAAKDMVSQKMCGFIGPPCI